MPPVVLTGVMGAVPVLFADRVGAVPLPDTCTVVEFAGSVAKPELAVALGADVDTTVVFDEEVVDVVVVGVG